MSETWSAGLILIGLVLIIIIIPCIFIGVLGSSMLNRLAYYPSKTPAIQMSIFFWLMLSEVVSITLLLMFYHVFADYGGTKKGAVNYERDADIAISCPHDYRDGHHHLLSA